MVVGTLAPLGELARAFRPAIIANLSGPRNYVPQATRCEKASPPLDVALCPIPSLIVYCFAWKCVVGYLNEFKGLLEAWIRLPCPPGQCLIFAT
jgi:hypothetical protein